MILAIIAVCHDPCRDMRISANSPRLMGKPRAYDRSKSRATVGDRERPQATVSDRKRSPKIA